MAPVRVVLVACSGLLGGLIREALAALPDVRVVRDLPGSGRLARVVRWRRPDVVVWRLDDDGFLTSRPDLFGAPSTTSVLTVRSDGDRGALWRLRSERTALAALSPGSFAEAVREAAR
jgi:chemotaxis response regulator CheB